MTSGQKGEPVIVRVGKTVLCIGNDPVPLNFRSSLLHKLGYNVLTAATGHEGVRVFTKEAVDAVVVDLGDEAETALITGELKRIGAHLPVVVLSVEQSSADPFPALSCDAVVRKAEESQSLPAVLTRLLLRK